MQAWLPLVQVKLQVLVEQLAWASAGVAAQQLVPQRVSLQLMSQPDEPHTAEPFEAGGLHLVPQLLQFDVSVARFTQEVPQRVVPGMPLQSITQAPPTHT